MDNLLAVGKITRLFGNEGGLIANLYDTFPADIRYEEPLYVVIDMLAVPLFIEEFSRKGRNGAFVRFSDIDTPQRAQELTGVELFIKAENDFSGMADPAGDGELLFEDLVGYRAVVFEQTSVNTGPRLEGSITGFIDNEMNPLLEIEAAGKEILVPAADEFIAGVNTASKTVEFILPEGFLELY